MAHFIVVELHQEVYEAPDCFSLHTYYKKGFTKEQVLKEVKESMRWCDYLVDVQVFEVDREPKELEVRHV